jgi:hypothetical protein
MATLFGFYDEISKSIATKFLLLLAKKLPSKFLALRYLGVAVL